MTTVKAPSYPKKEEEIPIMKTWNVLYSMKVEVVEVQVLTVTKQNTNTFQVD